MLWHLVGECPAQRRRQGQCTATAQVLNWNCGISVNVPGQGCSITRYHCHVSRPAHSCDCNRPFSSFSLPSSSSSSPPPVRRLLRLPPVSPPPVLAPITLHLSLYNISPRSDHSLATVPCSLPWPPPHSPLPSTNSPTSRYPTSRAISVLTREYVRGVKNPP